MPRRGSEWSPWKDFIKKLYVDEDRTLTEVVNCLKSDSNLGDRVK